MNKVVFSIDVGGSSVKYALIYPWGIEGNVEIQHYDSSASREVLLDFFASLMNKYPTVPLALSFPGPSDYTKGIIYIKGLSKLESLYGVSLIEELSQRGSRAPASIRMRNDAESAILGEVRYGSWQSRQRVMGITLGTGMGSSFIEKGRPVVIPHDYAEDGLLFPLPFRGGIADDFFSTRGLMERVKYYRHEAKNIPQLSQSAQGGSSIALKIFSEFGKDLAFFAQQNIERTKSQLLLIGGGICSTFPLFAEELRNGVSVPFHRFSLGEEAALRGVADLFYDDARFWSP